MTDLEVDDDKNESLGDVLKGAAVALGLVAVIPIFIPTAACVLAFTEIKEKLKRCPNCGSRRLIFKGKEHPASTGCREIRLERGTYKSRKLPVHSYFECADCTGRYKKFYGSPLGPATEEEFAEMSVNSF